MADISDPNVPVHHAGRGSIWRGAGWKRVIAPVAAISLLGPGCSTTDPTIQSSHQLVPSAAQPRGLTYFLPMRQARLTLSRTPADPEELIKKRDEKVVALAAAAAQAAAAKARREQAEAMLAALAANAASRPDQIKLVELAVAQENVLAAAAEALRVGVSDLDGQIVAARSEGGECRYTAKIELLPVQADPRERFVADLSHSRLRDDTVRLNVSPMGLLTSANVIAADQTVQILVELAGLAGSLAGARAALMDTPATETARPRCDGVPVLTRIFDPANGREVDSVNEDLDEAKFPFRIKMAIYEASTPGPIVTRVGEEFSDRGSDRQSTSRNYASVPGLYYRSPTPVLMELRYAPLQPAMASPPAAATGAPVDAVVMMLPQAGPISWLPMEASAFVTTTHDVQFADGSISSWSSERPSQFLAVAKAPGQAIGSFASALSRILTLRIETSDSREALGAQQIGEVVQQQRYRLLLDCLGRAGDETAASACLPETE